MLLDTRVSWKVDRVQHDAETKRKKDLIQEILQCVSANDVPVTGELILGLVFRTESELRQIAQELHIQVKK